MEEDQQVEVCVRKSSRLAARKLGTATRTDLSLDLRIRTSKQKKVGTSNDRFPGKQKSSNPEITGCFGCRSCSETLPQLSDQVDQPISLDLKSKSSFKITVAVNEKTEIISDGEYAKPIGNEINYSGMAADLAIKEGIDVYGLTGMDLLTYQCSNFLQTSFVSCTVCFQRLFSKSAVKEHIMIHNFFSCCCPVCQWQQGIFQRLQI